MEPFLQRLKTPALFFCFFFKKKNSPVIVFREFYKIFRVTFSRKNIKRQLRNFMFQLNMWFSAIHVIFMIKKVAYLQRSGHIKFFISAKVCDIQLTPFLTSFIQTVALYYYEKNNDHVIVFNIQQAIVMQYLSN